MRVFHAGSQCWLSKGFFKEEMYAIWDVIRDETESALWKNITKWSTYTTCSRKTCFCDYQIYCVGNYTARSVSRTYWGCIHNFLNDSLMHLCIEAWFQISQSLISTRFFWCDVMMNNEVKTKTAHESNYQVSDFSLKCGTGRHSLALCPPPQPQSHFLKTMNCHFLPVHQTSSFTCSHFPH